MIYLDNNATTPVDSRVLETMLPYFSQNFGNASSKQHPMGRMAEQAVEAVRQNVAHVLAVDSREIYFTSGATESCNIAIKGIVNLYRRKGKHIVVFSTEHKAVLDPSVFLESQGCEVTYVQVDSNGAPDLGSLERAIRTDTVLVCAMWANNETGAVFPMEQIGSICAKKGTLLFSDATQAVGKIDVRPRENDVQLLAFSAHKIYGPKGVGVLYVSRSAPRVKVQPLLHGGGHEGGIRSGTINVPGIVGLGRAVEIAHQDMQSEALRLQPLRDQLEKALLAIPEVHTNIAKGPRLAHVANIRFMHVDGEVLMAAFQQELAVSSGSACTSADPNPSHVLTAMGLTRSEAKSSLRFSLGRFTSQSDVLSAVDLVKSGVNAVRSENPAWQLYQQGLI